MDIDNFEWWYSEGEAPDEGWDEPAPSDVSSNEAETGNGPAESDAASGPAEPLTFEQAWAQAEADEAKADATAALGEPADMSISPAKTPQPRHNIDPGSTASFSILDVPAQGAQAPAPTRRPDLAREEDAGRRSPLGPILIAFMAGVIACSAIGGVWDHMERQRQEATAAEMSVERSLERARSVHVSVEVVDGTWDTARGDSRMLVHVVGRTLKKEEVNEFQYVDSAGDGIELRPGDYELTVEEPPVGIDGTRFRASKRMIPVNFNSQAPDEVDTDSQGRFDLYALAQ
ncbi:hypothetical protein [Collinsella aerofaciens]|uniref:hypothetical protein n=1 Tax=Collinsella aerofaciens TaxID=74426 RepID=UPI00359C8074